MVRIVAFGRTPAADRLVGNRPRFRRPQGLTRLTSTYSSRVSRHHHGSCTEKTCLPVALSADGDPKGVRRQRRGWSVRARHTGRPSPVTSYPKEGLPVRTFLRRLFAALSGPPTPTSTPPPAHRQAAAAPFSRNSRSATYRSAAQLPLRPWHVRNQRFGPTRLGRRGLDPDEVHVFLNRVAYDLHQVYTELAASRDENVRIKNALRQWQTLQAPPTRARHPRHHAHRAGRAGSRTPGVLRATPDQRTTLRAAHRPHRRLQPPDRPMTGRCPAGARRRST